MDTKYVNYLKSIEIAKRGFTRVPDIEYQNEKKMVNPIKGSLRFNYMFPIADAYLTQRDFSKESPKRAEFLRRQWIYCNSIEKNILKMAKHTYYSEINGIDKTLIHASCDFKLLEEASQNYSKIKKGDTQNN